MESLKLYDTISFYRKRQGLTQEELAKKLGVTNQSVSKWESAQCCPDIGLLPMLADIFEISIDELFGRKNEKEIHYDLCSELPWNDDNTIRVFRTLGKNILESTDENGWINISFPKECNEKTRQYFKVEVMGNLNCDASINGDVVCQENIECNDINGDVKECRGNISAAGDINVFARAQIVKGIYRVGHHFKNYRAAAPAFGFCKYTPFPQQTKQTCNYCRGGNTD